MTLTTETLNLWRNNAEITAGETAEDDPEHIAAKAILALTAELLASREAQPVAGECNKEVYENGQSVCLVDIPKETAEVICRGISQATGCKVDWHYIGGRVHIKALAPPAPAVNASPDFEAWFVEKYKQPERLVKNEDGTYKFAGVQMAFSAWVDGRAAMLAQPVSQGYKLPDGFKLMPLEMTDEIGEAIAMEARCCGGIALCIYEAALAASPESGNDHDTGR
ncbi:TPA: hypothetical protein ACXI7C_000460 [Serratia marcescens]